MVNKENTKQIKKPDEGKKMLWPFLLVICLVCISLYYKSTNNQFLDLDDSTIIVKNYPFLKNAGNIPKAFTQGVFQIPGEKDTLASFYRPVMTVSFIIDAKLSSSYSPNPAPFLRANIFYHMVACILLMLLLLELNLDRIPSLLMTLIFAVHPLLNQAVAWIPGRNDSLLTIFILLSLLFLLKYRKTKKTSQFSLHIFFFVLALFTKENAVMFIPLVFILLRFIYKEPASGGNYKKLGIAYLLCILPWIFIRQHALANNINNNTISDSLHVFISNLPYFIQYAGKTLLPFNLSVMSAPADTNYLLGLVTIGLFVGYFVISKEKNISTVLFGVLWFLFFLAPSFLSGFSGLEHRAYLPLIGIILSVSQLGWIQHAGITPMRSKGFAGFIILCAVFIMYLSISIERLPIFRNKFAFDKSAMETSQSTLPCLYLAKHYEEAGDSNKMAGYNDIAAKNYNLAIEANKEALRRDSMLETIHSNIAGEYIRMNDFQNAEKELTIELSKHPKNAIGVFDMGLVLFQYERKDSLAVLMWKKSLTLDSSFAQPYKVLSQYYQAMGDSSNAILYRSFYKRKRPKQ